jgi:hypothetical protein
MMICQFGVLNILKHVLNHIKIEKFPYSKYDIINETKGITDLEGNVLIKLFLR